MHKAYRHGTFSHSGGYAVHGAGAYIACGKNTGTACFQEIRVALQLPYFFIILIMLQVAAGFNKAFIIGDNFIIEPVNNFTIAL